MGSSRFIYRSGLNGFILLLLTSRFINLAWDVPMYNNVVVHAWRHVYIWHSATPALAVSGKLGQMSIHDIYFVSSCFMTYFKRTFMNMKLTLDTETLKAVDILSFNYTNLRILEIGGLLNVDRHSRFFYHIFSLKEINA